MTVGFFYKTKYSIILYNDSKIPFTFFDNNSKIYIKKEKTTKKEKKGL